MTLRISFLAILTFLLMNCGGKKIEEVVESIRPVRYGVIINSGGQGKQTFSGSAHSSKEAKLSFKVTGTINTLRVKVGDRINRGQLIAALDPIDYNVEFEQSKAQLKNSETQISRARTTLVTERSNYERVEKLYENNSVPLSEYEQAKSKYEAAQSELAAAEAQVSASNRQVEAARNQVDYASLKAPFTGIITEVYVEENELVGSGGEVAVLSAEVDPEVNVSLPELFISRVNKGEKVDISFPTLPTQTFSGTITEVSFSSGDGATYPVVARIDNPSKDIRPGMSANITFFFGASKSDEQHLIAPVKAVGEGVDGRFVFVLEEDGANYIAKKREIEIGELFSDGFIIKSGLEEGERVATAGLKSLLDGMKVKLLDE